MEAKLFEVTQCSQLPAFPPFLLRQLSTNVTANPNLVHILFENKNISIQRSNQLQALFKDMYLFDSTLSSPNESCAPLTIFPEREELVGDLQNDIHFNGFYDLSSLNRNLVPSVVSSTERFEQFLSDQTISEKFVSEMMMSILSRIKSNNSKNEPELRKEFVSPSTYSTTPPSSPSLDPASPSIVEQFLPPRLDLEWNVEVFVSTINQVNPNLNWVEAFAKLDCPSFCFLTRVLFAFYSKCIPWQKIKVFLFMRICFLSIG